MQLDIKALQDDVEKKKAEKETPIHIANVVLLPEQRDLTTNANMILFKFAI